MKQEAKMSNIANSVSMRKIFELNTDESKSKTVDSIIDAVLQIPELSGSTANNFYYQMKFLILLRDFFIEVEMGKPSAN